jgi:MFS family permease
VNAGATIRRLRANTAALPAQYRLLVAATFVYLASASLIYPFLGIYMRQHLHVSLTVVGLVLGASSLAGLPLQVLGGWWADHRGRRGVMLLSMLASAGLLLALAGAHQFWLVVVLVIAQGALGWPLFLTVSNAMVADLVPRERSAEAYSIIRIALNLGAVFGPALAGVSLAAGLSYSNLFAAAGSGEVVLWLVLVARLRETRPPAAARAAAMPAAPAQRSGYRLVLADRRFLAFCAVSVLPLFVYGQISSTYPVYVTTFLHLPVGTWGLLLAFNAALVVSVQYPLVRRLLRRRHYLLVALGSLLLGVGMGGSSLAAGAWTLFLLMAVFSFGEMIFVPFSSGVAAEMATVAERGRYMGIWSLVWVGGQALGPLFGGMLMASLGGRGAYGVVFAAGSLGTVLFAVLPAARRRPAAMVGENAGREEPVAGNRTGGEEPVTGEPAVSESDEAALAAGLGAAAALGGPLDEPRLHARTSDNHRGGQDC